MTTIERAEAAPFLHIRVDDLQGAQIIALLQEHVDAMRSTSPAESCHVLDLQELKHPDITFWSIWDGDQLAGCGALKRLDEAHGEIKSMRTARGHLRKGVASRVLKHIVSEAQKKGYRRLSLETGSQPYFDPARRLYRSFGFSECPPFGDYVLDPNSIFMTRELA